MTQSNYAASGVDIDSGNRAVDLMKDAVKSTYTSSVLVGIGSFGGLFDASALKEMKSPVLVASTDGVGTKVKLAASVGRYRSIGHDIVNHCINDILVQGIRVFKHVLKLGLCRLWTVFIFCMIAESFSSILLILLARGPFE